MPILENTRHERFAQGIAKGETQVVAYEAAGYKPNDSAAARLFGDVRIRERVDELKAKAAQRCEITIADLVTELEEARTLAKEVAQPSAAVSATMGKAKLLGLDVQKHEHSGAIQVQKIVHEVIDPKDAG